MREIKDDENHSEEPSERKPLFTRAAPVIDPPPPLLHYQSSCCLISEAVVLTPDWGDRREEPMDSALCYCGRTT